MTLRWLHKADGVKTNAARLLGLSDADGAIVLIGPDRPVQAGSRMH